MKSLIEFAPELRQMYVVEKKSIRAIAKHFGSYPVAVYRALQTLNIPIRDKSQAAKEALDSGRAVHPTKGKNLTAETKNKIGQSVADKWENMSDTQRETISQKHKDIWKDKTPEEKRDLFTKSHAAIAESARTGSKMEKFLMEALTAKGFDCYPHTKVLENNSLEVDLALPSLQIAIELDGPSHFLPIWGEEVLRKTKASDAEKNGILMLNGITVIRVLYTKGHVSNVIKQKVLIKLLETIEIAQTSTNKLFYVEI